MKVVNRLGWAVVVALTILLVATAARVERWIGGGRAARLAFEVTLPADDPRAEPDRVAPVLRSRLQGRAPSIRRGATPLQLVGEVNGDASDVEQVRELLTRSGRLELYEIVHETDTARDWYQRAREGALGPDVTGEVDTWSNDRVGDMYLDTYLKAPSAAALDSALAQLPPPPPDVRVVYEPIAPRVDVEAPDRHPYVRTYLVASEPELDGSHVASASVAYDPDTMRPEVVVRFTADGRQRFGDVTGRIAGRKLAIVLDGVVNSAPIVQQRITGGVCTITMGGVDRRAMEAEANLLVNTLRAGAALPEGMQATLRHARSGAAGHRWLPRVVLALLAGLAAFLLAPLLARHATGGVAAPLAPGGRGLPQLAVATALTIGLPVLLIVVGDRVLVPGVDEAILGDILHRVSGEAPTARFGILSLGIMSILSGFWLVELVAVAVPRWRRRRLGTPADRRGLDRAAVALGLALAAVQAIFVARYLQSIDLLGAVAVEPGDTTFALIVLTLVAGVAVHVVAADLISRHGLCNGYAALLGAGLLLQLYRLFAEGPHPGLPDARLTLAAVLAVLALAAIVASSLRDDTGERRPLPWTGLVPVVALAIGMSLIVLLWQATTVLDGSMIDLSPLRFFLDPPVWFGVAVAAAVTAAIVALTVGREALASRLGLAITVGYLAVLLLAHLATPTVAVPFLLIPVTVLTAALVDAALAARARLGMASPTIILAVHDADRAARAADALAAAGIPASVENRRLRALLRGLAAYAPIVVRVDQADAEAALAAVADAEAARDPLVAPFAA